MIPRISYVKPLSKYILKVGFDDGTTVEYDCKEDISALPGYDALMNSDDLFRQVKVDDSRTVVYWTDNIDLPSDILYEYGDKLGS